MKLFEDLLEKNGWASLYYIVYVCMYISYGTLEGTKSWDTVPMLRETHYFIVQLG